MKADVFNTKQAGRDEKQLIACLDYLYRVRACWAHAEFYVRL